MLSKAKQLLIDNNVKLVIIKDDITTSSNERGIKALLEILDSNSDFSGAYAADKAADAKSSAGEGSICFIGFT